MLLIEQTRPDLAVVDIRLPPGFTDEGITAAATIRSRWPEVAVLVLSTYAETTYAAQLLAGSDHAVGYLLKDRLADTPTLLHALRRLRQGDCVIDPTIVARLVARGRDQARLDPLTDRERDVLALMA
jgi:DNA-binding NarL/FixJ family response regulator